MREPSPARTNFLHALAACVDAAPEVVQRRLFVSWKIFGAEPSFPGDGGCWALLTDILETIDGELMPRFANTGGGK